MPRHTNTTDTDTPATPRHTTGRHNRPRRHVPWGDHVLRGREGFTVAATMAQAVTMLAGHLSHATYMATRKRRARSA